MRVKTYTLDGTHGPDAELYRDAQMQLWLNDLPVLAVSVWGPKVAFTLINRVALIAVEDYSRVTGYLGLGTEYRQLIHPPFR
jgi:hypothetical protein